MGNRDDVDPTKIPDFSFLSQGQVLAKGASFIQSDYRLAIDNLMDLSHLEFVHAGTFGGRRIIDRSVYEVHDIGGSIEASWSMADIAAPRPGLMSDRVDHWLRMRWNAPSSLELEVGFSAAGGAGDTLRDLQAHIVTPAGPSSCWYFWAAPARLPKVGDAGDLERSDLRAAFDDEDKPMLEAVQRNMRSDGNLVEMKPCYLPYDEAGMRVRRRLEQLVAAEDACALSSTA